MKFILDKVCEAKRVGSEFFMSVKIKYYVQGTMHCLFFLVLMNYELLDTVEFKL